MRQTASSISMFSDLGKAYEEKGRAWYLLLIEGSEQRIADLEGELAKFAAREGVYAEHVRKDHPREIALERKRVERFEKAMSGMAG